MDTTICEFRGPLHGVVLRQEEDGMYYTRRFNTRPDLGYSDNEYEGDYGLPTWPGAWDNFIMRVERCRHTTGGDLRERAEKEAKHAG